ncbi:MAG: DUF4333 domain-containing protein [Leptolyngbyaceae cyanobacterium bins.302]|nr:DUF4333 domain-containing protein [Leptolyngbyaceae cyanobacterium bins.302]
MSGQHRHRTQLQFSREGQYLGWAIALGMLLASCTPTQTAVTPTPSPSPTGSPTPTVTMSPSATPSPTDSPTVAASPSSGKPENVTKIETQIAQLVTKTANLSVQSVNCPAAIEEKPGKSYDCEVQSEAGTFVVVVQPTGEAGKFRWGTRGLLLLSKLDSFIQQSVASKGGGKVTVDCGTKARTAKAGETFDCKVTDAKGTAKTVRITVRDDQGNVYLSGL